MRDRGGGQLGGATIAPNTNPAANGIPGTSRCATYPTASAGQYEAPLTAAQIDPTLARRSRRLVSSASGIEQRWQETNQHQLRIQLVVQQVGHQADQMPAIVPARSAAARLFRATADTAVAPTTRAAHQRHRILLSRRSPPPRTHSDSDRDQAVDRAARLA